MANKRPIQESEENQSSTNQPKVAPSKRVKQSKVDSNNMPSQKNVNKEKKQTGEMKQKKTKKNKSEKRTNHSGKLTNPDSSSSTTTDSRYVKTRARSATNGIELNDNTASENDSLASNTLDEMQQRRNHHSSDSDSSSDTSDTDTEDGSDEELQPTSLLAVASAAAALAKASTTPLVTPATATTNAIPIFPKGFSNPSYPQQRSQQSQPQYITTIASSTPSGFPMYTLPVTQANSTYNPNHIQAKRFFCGICNKGFTQKGGLINHERIHKGERPFKCGRGGCGKSFAQKCNLTRHELVHTGEKPYVCGTKGCQATFKRKSGLLQHIQAYHEIFTNPITNDLPTLPIQILPQSQILQQQSMDHTVIPTQLLSQEIDSLSKEVDNQAAAELVTL